MKALNRRALLVLLLVTWVGVIFPSGVANAYCTTRERIQLRNEGVSPQEIDRLCGGAPPQGQMQEQFPRNFQPAPRLPVAAVCVTNAGPCPMAVAMPIGSACACYTQWGAVPGVAR